MTPISLSISTAGGDEIANALATMNAVAEDWRGAWPSVALRFRRQVGTAFATEGSSGRAGRWAPLSDRYKRWKDRFYPGRGILILTGRLHDSLTSSSDPDAIEVVGARFLFIGSRVPYAGFHQSGTGRMARRPPFSPTDRDVYEWVAEMQRYMNERLRAATGRSTGRLSTAFA